MARNLSQPALLLKMHQILDFEQRLSHAAVNGHVQSVKNRNQFLFFLSNEKTNTTIENE